MGAKGRLIVPNVSIVEALPFNRTSTGYTDQIWKYRRKLKLSAPVSMDVARAHAEMVQDVCCVVREKPKGPRGGRGAMHYNGEPSFGSWWPNSWNRTRSGCTFFLVTEIVSRSFLELEKERALMTAYGASPAMAQTITKSLEVFQAATAEALSTGMSLIKVDEASGFANISPEAWGLLTGDKP